jgi:hypothetical protein
MIRQSSAVLDDQPRRRWLVPVLVVIAIAACALVLLAGTRLLYECVTSGLPDRVHFEERDYNRGRTEDIPADAVESGRTSSGELVYKPAGEVGLSVIIWVASQEHDHARVYGLVGRP